MIKIFLFLFLFMPLLVFSQENEFVKYSKEKFPAYPVKISSVSILKNEIKSQEVLNEKTNLSGAIRVSYGYDIRIDFLKQATKFQTDSGVCYIMHFSIEEGETFAMSADSFLLTDGAKLILSDSTGIFEVYNEDTEIRKVYNKDFVSIGNPFKTGKEFFMTVFANNENVIGKCKVSINAISIYVVPINPAKKKRVC